jgi:hypothetical protein
MFVRNNSLSRVTSSADRLLKMPISIRTLGGDTLLDTAEEAFSDNFFLVTGTTCAYQLFETPNAE